MDNKPTGRKDDNGKLRWHLLPFAQVKQIVQVLMHGEEKYGAENWKEVPGARVRYLDAAFRHITSWQSGDKRDPDTGFSHLAHAACCLLFMMFFDDESTKKKIEDEPEIKMACECGGKMTSTVDIVKGTRTGLVWECEQCRRTVLAYSVAKA